MTRHSADHPDRELLLGEARGVSQDQLPRHDLRGGARHRRTRHTQVDNMHPDSGGAILHWFLEPAGDPWAASAGRRWACPRWGRRGPGHGQDPSPGTGDKINIYSLIKSIFMLSALLNKVLPKYSSNSVEWNYFSTLWKLCLLPKLHFITFTPNALLIKSNMYSIHIHQTPTKMHLDIRWILLSSVPWYDSSY